MSFVNIGGKKISWSFVQKVRSLANKDWDVTMDIFWKARNAKGGARGIIRYIMAGFKKRSDGTVPYNLHPSKERENGQMETIRQWWLGEVYVPKKTVMSIKEIFAAIAQGKE